MGKNVNATNKNGNLAVIVGIKDEKMGCFLQVYVQRNLSVAIRGFSEICQKNENIKNYPNDFNFYCLGDINEENGDILPTPTGAQLISKAKDFIQKETK